MNALLSLCALLVFHLAVAGQAEPPPIFQAEPRPMPASVQRENGLVLELHHNALEQGGVALLRLTGADIEAARARFFRQDIPFFFIKGDAWYALIAVPLEAAPGTHELTVGVESEAGERRLEREVEVAAGNFIRQDFVLAGRAGQLASAAAERQAQALLKAITDEPLPEPLWGVAGFTLPHDGPLTSPFGAFRLLNDAHRTRHFGWDQNAAEGSPVRSMAAGIVAHVAAGGQGVYGGLVALDHGAGLFSSYAHLSQARVAAGQRVEAGEIIGDSGNTGRSSAPHLHWEVLVHGQRVDGLALLELWLPA